VILARATRAPVTLVLVTLVLVTHVQAAWPLRPWPVPQAWPAPPQQRTPACPNAWA